MQIIVFFLYFHKLWRYWLAWPFLKRSLTRYLNMNFTFSWRNICQCSYKYVLEDIKEGIKITLTDRDWHKPYYREINNVHYSQFPWKRDWIHQPLEGVALYLGRGRSVCSKRLTEIEDNFYNLCHPYYQTKFSNWVNRTRQEAQLVNHKYFHC